VNLTFKFEIWIISIHWQQGILSIQKVKKSKKNCTSLQGIL
jgi:hypothetical protein